MRVRIVSLGTNWWSAHSSNVADPFCFRRNAAWFNSAGLKFGNRLRLCWAYPGQLRFNRTSGFNPEFRHRCLGITFECDGPNRMHDRMHLLVAQPARPNLPPDRYLVTFSDRLCGSIRFNRPEWKSGDVQLICASVRRDRYEVMALMSEASWIESAVGLWTLTRDRKGLALSEAPSGGQI